MQFALEVAVLECSFLKHSQRILEVKETNSMTTTIRIPPYSKCGTILQTFFNDRT
jgi:hypothetical protein